MAQTTQWLSPRTLVQTDPDEKTVAVSHDAGETWKEIYREEGDMEKERENTETQSEPTSTPETAGNAGDKTADDAAEKDDTTGDAQKQA